MPPTKKACTRCGRMLPLGAFSPCPHGKLGRYSRCKQCHALMARIRRAKGDNSRESHRRWRRRNRAAAAASAQRWKKRNPERERAHQAVRAAVLGGLLRRPDCCENCGRARQVVAHHADYSRPLDVDWLCRRCHSARHVDKRLNRTSHAA